MLWKLLTTTSILNTIYFFHFLSFTSSIQGWWVEWHILWIFFTIEDSTTRLWLFYSKLFSRRVSSSYLLLKPAKPDMSFAAAAWKLDSLLARSLWWLSCLHSGNSAHFQSTLNAGTVCLFFSCDSSKHCSPADRRIAIFIETHINSIPNIVNISHP